MTSRTVTLNECEASVLVRSAERLADMKTPRALPPNTYQDTSPLAQCDKTS